jgi:hypothetical protein
MITYTLYSVQVYIWAINEENILNLYQQSQGEKGHLVAPKILIKFCHIISNESFTIHYDRGCEAFIGLVDDYNMTTVNFV